MYTILRFTSPSQPLPKHPPQHMGHCRAGGQPSGAACSRSRTQTARTSLRNGRAAQARRNRRRDASRPWPPFNDSSSARLFFPRATRVRALAYIQCRGPLPRVHGATGRAPDARAPAREEGVVSPESTVQWARPGRWPLMAVHKNRG